jgi:hypothetical protein
VGGGVDAGLVADALFIAQIFLQRGFDWLLVVTLLLSGKGWGLVRTRVAKSEVLNVFRTSARVPHSLAFVVACA